ncbi:MFS transporter [Paenibacillus thermotolerans]|uniref:MFS transporter n=1 Tax=Paenibacillus thermotolerans TaxID=3027807 RepID=UPI00236763E7|nr:MULTISPECIES: MFS transporter [unclassified Paenibacillus]
MEERLWKNKQFVWFISGQTVCEFGSAVHLFVLPWLLLQITGSATVLGIAMAVGFLPYLLLSLPFGALADRHDRKLLMLAANAGRLVLTASIPIAALFRELHPVHLFIVQGGMSAMGALFDAGYVASLPSIVTKKQLQEANAALQGGISVSQLSGPAIAGLLISWFGGSYTLSFTAASFLISVLSLRMISSSFKGEGGDRERLTAQRMMKQIGEGVRYVMNHSLIRPLTVLAMMINLSALAMNPAMLYRLQTEMGLDSKAAGFVMAGWGVGTVIGSLAAAKFFKRLRLGIVMVFSLSLQIVTPFLVVFVEQTTVMLIAYAIYGFAVVLWNVQSLSLRQSVIPSELMGRATTTIRFLVFATIPLGTVIGGALSEHFGAVTAFLFSGAIQLVIWLWAFRNRLFFTETPGVGASQTM